MRTALVIVGIVLLLCVCFLPAKQMAGSTDAYTNAVFFGWIAYPIRLANEHDIAWPNTILCVICLAGLTFGVHYFGCWFAANRPTLTRWPLSHSLKLVGLVILMFLAGIAAIGIIHEAVWLQSNRDKMVVDHSAGRVQSANHLKQLALGGISHHDVHKHLPPGGTFDAQGGSLHGWQTLILPYVDQEPLFKQIDLTVPWHAPKNAAALKSEVVIFSHPIIDVKHDRNGYALSHYAGNVHVLGVKPMKLNDITDGASTTILMGEVAENFKPWGAPMNCRDPSVGLNVPGGFGSTYRRNYVMVAMADGTVRALSAAISPAVLKAISTPRGGEKAEPADLGD